MSTCCHETKPPSKRIRQLSKSAFLPTRKLPPAVKTRDCGPPRTDICRQSSQTPSHNTTMSVQPKPSSDRLTSLQSSTIPNLRNWDVTSTTHNSNPSLTIGPSGTAKLQPPWRNGSGGGGGATTIAVGAREKELSGGTRGILKSMMHSSKLSSTQQRFLDEFLTSGSPLPAHPTAGMTFRNPNPHEPDTPIAALPQQGRRAHYGRRPTIRTLETIARSDAFEMEPYRPGVHKDYTAEKNRLQSIMANNGTLSISPAAETEQGEGGRLGRRGGHRDEQHEEELDEFEMLMQEIKDRRQWLDDMIAMGHGDGHKRQIQLEISQRIRRLEKIDAERSRLEGLTRMAR
ncbi:hypothetical protein DFJ77DRAFT_478509 [Powellomyces hirtus]|nr:hypothetical protein DFJ77DRAFT_478509 [Powellomyces hirtus]